MMRWRFALFTLAFDLYWALAVMLRERVALVLCAVALLGWLLCPRPVKLRLLAVAVAGMTLDTLWLWLGLFSFSGQAWFPAWMLGLWLAFACWWWLVDSRFTLRFPLLAVLGGLGGPLAYFIGDRLGAMVLHLPVWQVMLALAAGWAVYLPLVSRLLRGRWGAGLR